MKYAIIQTGAKQYKVKEGEELLIEKLQGKEGDTLTFSEVLLMVDNGTSRIGQPTLTNVVVKGKILAQIKSEKIRVATYKAKSRYRRVKGHRQQLTKIQIEKISEKRGKAKRKKGK